MSVAPGTRFGAYEILAKLGEGGMGEVFRARDARLGREVAIKFLSEALRLDENGLVRFEREARAASSLSHPNIVTVHDVGVLEGRPYIVMELIRGETLRARLAAGALPSRELLELATQVSEALAKAHASGIVHRDLKPENVMITADGYAKVLDFGLAKLGATLGAPGQAPTSSISSAETVVESLAGVEASQPGTLLGTIGYMAPEQIRSSGVDFRADQFAFGAILYEMATGRRAFEGKHRAEVLTAILSTDPISIVALNPRFPPPARWIVERCLAKDPAHRYASTVDLARELRTVRDHLDETTSAAASGAATTPLSSARPGRRRLLAMAAAVALVGLGALAAPAIRRLLRPPIPEQKQVVVLPFRNTSGDPRQQVLCDGLIETLTSGLTQLERFHGSYSVVPASEVRQSGTESVSKAREVLGATLAITGSIQHAGDRLRLTANLVDTSTRLQLRAISFDAALDEMTKIQDGMVQRVGDMLELEMGAEEKRLLAAGRTSSAGAYEAYLRGMGHLLDYQSAASLDAAVGDFQDALQRDPEYALAYAGLGEAYWRRYELDRDPESVELARRSCERAVSLNDLMAPVHVTLGIVHRGTGELERAVEDFGRALRLDPGNALALRELGRTFERLGRKKEAEETFRRAIELRPSSWSGHNLLGGFLFDSGRHEEAVVEFRRVTEIAPQNPRGYNNLGGTLILLGRSEEARDAFDRAIALEPTSSGYSNLGTLEFGLGRLEAATRSFERAIELGSRDYRVWQNLGAAYLAIPGQEERSRPAYAHAAELAAEQAAVDPRDLAVQADLAECEAMLGEGAAARRRIETVLAARTADAEILRRAVTVYERTGDRDAALARLGEAFAAGLTLRQIERDPGLVELRRDPRFKALVPRGAVKGETKSTPGGGR